jgi:hypothetical protein
MDALLSMLKEDQLRHWETVKWLVGDDGKREGRSTLLALAMIAEADRHPERWVPLWDHYMDTKQTRDLVVDRVEALLDHLATLDPAWKQKEFRVSAAYPYSLRRIVPLLRRE